MKHTLQLIPVFLLATLPAVPCATAAAKPLKVFILAGQSNMQGHAKVSTFEHIGMDPAMQPMLAEMQNADGSPKVCERVWISSIGCADAEQTGKLTTGFGASQNGPKIGPEFTFGLYMQKFTDAPILLIKTAWGGKSLNTDFRPPSAGPYEFNDAQLEGLKKQGKDVAQAKADKAKATGRYYRLMMDHVKKILADPKRVVPDYDPKQGCEIAGFVWLQGFNDMVDGATYPDGKKPGGYAKYSEWMADFIRDVRKDLSAPKMPFVIGVIGVGGDKATGGAANLRPAMAAPAEMPEFKGNVFAVQTAPFWNKPLADIADKLDLLKGAAHLTGGKTIPWNVISSRHPIAYSLRDKYMGEDGTMTKQQQQAFLKEYRAKLITPEEEAMWKRGASNAGYHYLGCAKTFALMGKAFAQAILEMQKK